MLNIIELKQHSIERHFTNTEVHFLKMLQKYLTCCPEGDHHHREKRLAYLYLYIFLLSFYSHTATVFLHR